MNIFVLHPQADMSVSQHCDKHICKMCLEYGQLLATAMHVRYKELGQAAIDIIKPTHINHPSALWVRSGYAQYEYVYDMFLECLRQYTIRYGKIHAWHKCDERVQG